MGAIANILNIIREVSLGEFYFQIAFLFHLCFFEQPKDFNGKWNPSSSYDPDHHTNEPGNQPPDNKEIKNLRQEEILVDFNLVYPSDCEMKVR